MRSSVSLTFGLFDTTAKSDSALSSQDRQPFVNLDELKTEEVTPSIKTATLEDNLFLLDGSYQPFPDTPAGEFWGWWSSTMSGADGVFLVPPALTISFTEPHSSMGVTFRFDTATGDTVSHLKITWKDADGNTLIAKEFWPDSAVYLASCKVENYYQIVVEALATSKPYRYAKVEWIGYGAELTFGGNEVVSANLLEELDPLSNEITVNTLDFTLHSKAADFSMLNPQGMFSLLQQRQPIKAKEQVNGSVIPLGTFYLDEWESDTENKVKFTAVDWIGVLDQSTCLGGVYENVPATTILTEILGEAPYSLDSTLQSAALTGYLAICTRREALQQVAFALGAVVDCSRGDQIKIYPPPERPSSLIGWNRKFDGGKLKLEPAVTGVDVIAHKYIPDAEVKELYKDALAPGSYTVTFDSPAHSLTITGGTITASGANYASITVAEEGEVTISGKGYTDSTQVVSKRQEPLPSGIQENTLRVEGATLISAANAKAAADRIFEYHQNRFTNEITILPAAETVGDMVVVQSYRNEKLRGVIESLEYDLTGGWRAKAKVRGVRIETVNGYYSGELKTGEVMGVM